MKNLWQKLLAFLGFGQTDAGIDDSFDEMLRHLTSKERLDDCEKMAFQAIKNNDSILPGMLHPYEGSIKVECIKVDSALSASRNSQAAQAFGGKNSLLSHASGGLPVQLSSYTAKSLENKISAAIAQRQSETERLKNKLEARERDLRVFMGAAGLTGSLEQPNTSNLIYLALGFCIFEIIANAWFLREAFIPLNAFFIAAALAIMNVGGCLWLGNLYREKNHSDPKRAAKGKYYFYYASALMLSVGIIIALARFWSQYGIDTTSDVQGDFIIESIVLFAAGIWLGILAFNKGYAMDHPYPGLGSLVREVDDLREQFDEICTSHAKLCENERLSAEAAHRSLKQQILSEASGLSQMIPKFSKFIGEWAQDRERINSAYKQHQQIFKAIMENYKKTEISYPQELKSLDPSDELENLRRDLDQLTKKSKNINQEVEQLVSIIDTSLAELQNWTNTEKGKEMLQWPR